MADVDDADLRVLEGCALPPKVDGAQRGAVLLSVPHVLPSATTDAAAARSAGVDGGVDGGADGGGSHVPRLPAAPLVRVRWWGEDRLGSTLFRPTRIAHEQEDETARGGHADDQDDDSADEDDDTGDSSIRMRYPVCVPLEQLLEYLRDMHELVFDVVDRTTRKKVGRSVLPFQLDGGATDAEQAAASLRRVNALCEIQSTVDAAVVLGYLTVNFEIEWPLAAEVSTPLKWANTMGMAPSVSVNPRQTIGITGHETERSVQQRLSFSSISSSSTLSGFQRLAPWRRAGGEANTTVPTNASTSGGRLPGASVRLEGLLEKGRALERSMSKAVKDEAAVSTPTRLVVDTTQSAPSPVSLAMLIAPYEAMTEELDTSWERVLEEAEKIHGSGPMGQTVPVQAVKGMRQELDGLSVSLGGHNALEISFESMELEQEMMDRLRQLREGSVSTRFSPIQLVVSHEHPSHVLHPSTSSDKDPWIAAFAVNSSLQKRHWRTNYTHTLPLVADGSSQANAGTQNAQVNQRLLKFRVRCKPQHASPPGSRRRGRPTQVCDLSTSVSVKELLEHRDRPWVLSLPLRIEGEISRFTTDRRVAKRAAAVGTITVKFRFCCLPDAADEQNDQQSDDAESSAWSLADQDHQYVTPHSRPTRNLTAPPNQLGDSPHRSSQRGVGIPLFFVLLIGRAMVTRESDPQTKSGNDHQVVPKLSVRFDYGTPAFFGRSARALRLKRSAKASLRVVGKHRLKANVSHMNAFPLDVSDEFIEKLHHGLLILEAWIQERPTALKSYVNEKLLGVVKIPLHVFASCTRDRDAISSCLGHAIPHIGVDQDFPIVDPLDNQVNGQVHVRMAFGSAEQMFNLKSSLVAVIKLQTLVRGWLARRAIAYWKRFQLAGFEDGDDEVEVVARGSQQITDDVRDSSASEIVAQSDSEMSGPSVIRDNTIESHVSERISRIEIRVEVRQSYRKMVQASTPVIGCEVHGQLRYNDERDGQSGPIASGPRFTLWWDANEAQLNSFFIHTLQASSSSTGIELQDVLLLFRIEPQLTTAAKAIPDDGVGSVKGGAGIDLGSVIAEDGSGFEGIDQFPIAGDYVEDIDLPVEWGLSGTEAQDRGLVETLPLRISVRITRGGAQDDDPRALKGITEMVEAKSLALDDDSEEVAAVQTISRTERLLPASLHLNLDIQRVSELRDMIQEQLAAATRRPDSDHAVKTLREVIDRGSLTMTIVMSLCLGVELHPEEHDHNNGDTLFQDDQKHWHKRFRFEHIQLDLVNGVQALPSITQGAVHVIVHPELVAFLQAGSLDTQLLVCDGDGDVLVGTVSVPVSAILFRPSGVQGSFPVRVDNGLAGRVGVHLCIDQDETLDRSPSRSSARRYSDRAARERIERPPAPQGSAGLGVAEEGGVNKSEEQTLEQAVASIHEAAQQIQNRLARLTTHSSQPESDGQGDGPRLVSISPNEEASLKLSTLEVSSSATSSAQHSPRARYQRFTHAEEVTHTEDFAVGQLQDSDRSEGVGSEKVAASDAADDLDVFRPITLASFGIEEMELSPIIEADSPTFRYDEERVQPSNDTDFGGSEAFHGVEEPANMSEDSFPVDAEELTDTSEIDHHNFVDDLGDRNEDDCHDHSEEVSDMSKSECHEDVEVLPDLSENESHAHIEELADVSEEHHELTSQDGEVVSSRDCGALSSEPKESKAVDVMISSGMPISHSPVRAYAGEPDEQGTSTEYVGRSIGQDGQNVSGAGDPGSMIVESTVATDSSETCEADATGDSIATEVRMSNNDSTCAVEADHSFVSSVTSHNEAVTENDVDPSGSDDGEVPGIDALQSVSGDDENEDYIGEVSSVDIDETLDDEAEESLKAQDVHPQQLSIELCESSTQTEGENRAESVTSGAHILPARADEKNVTVDICCQTEPDPQYEVGDNDVQPTLPLDEPAADSATDSQTQGCHEDSSEIRDSSSHVSVNAVGTNSVQVTDISQVLPAEKFKIAWQLLSEIRALYVDPSSQDQSALASLTSEEAENAALRAQDLVVNQDSSCVKPALPKMGASVAQEQEYVSSRHTESIYEQHETATREDSVPIAASANAWHWRDADSLKAEVEERLQASKREYEEALALSQSMQSMKSWSTSSHVSTNREMTAQWEEKARELSASALAKRQHSARTLFRVDTETERIARIMQGSMRYWLHEDDDEGDGCEISDDDVELVDNYF